MHRINSSSSLIVTVGAFLGAVELGFLPHRQLGFWCKDPIISFPFKGETISSAVLIGITVFLPLLVVSWDDRRQMWKELRFQANYSLDGVFAEGNQVNVFIFRCGHWNGFATSLIATGTSGLDAQEQEADRFGHGTGNTSVWLSLCSACANSSRSSSAPRGPTSSTLVCHSKG